MASISSPHLNRNTDPELQEPLTVAELQQRFREQADQALCFVLDPREEKTEARRPGRV